MIEKYEAESSLIILGADGPAENSGYKSGIIRRTEIALNRPLLWAICLLHYNELYLRKLFELLDIGWSSDATFRGPIGKNFQKGLKLDLEPKNFQRIQSNIPNDQKIPQDHGGDQEGL